MPKKSMPTGEEPPKGYETLVSTRASEDAIRIDLVAYTHLARGEKTEIEALRTKALSKVNFYTGLSNTPLTFENEANIIPDRHDSDKMLARAYADKCLVGYALIIMGWPERSYWLIQHMIIDPSKRNLGIGTAIIQSIEQYALDSEVDTSSILAIPVQQSGREFWSRHGYTAEAFRQLIKIADVDHEIVVYHKEL
ncbi:MAG: GNAT family N-acetyltransferase [Coriobacteriales bacterium]|nr:GNAT family N-acetyltransferase [Coriobacteriales bacterium]